MDNIVATLPGRDPTGTVMVAAHYDSAAMGPGASDDGAAVAAMLETVRALRAQEDQEGRGGGGNLRNDLVFLMTDGEEDGVLGAEAFVREHPLAIAAACSTTARTCWRSPAPWATPPCPPWSPAETSPTSGSWEPWSRTPATWSRPWRRSPCCPWRD
ncbi:M28 family peptidase [Streptosporangium sp. OZ121]|uniref:M28 family peptidase n=1 Tax=Streptosporangium sp. OZ121 TaxID=3444183 RepID=UPI003F7AF32B